MGDFYNPFLFEKITNLVSLWDEKRKEFYTLAFSESEI